MIKEQPVEKPSRREACRRPQWRGPAMTLTAIPGVGMTLLCNNPTDCRSHWPHDAPGPK